MIEFKKDTFSTHNLIAYLGSLVVGFGLAGLIYLIGKGL